MRVDADTSTDESSDSGLSDVLNSAMSRVDTKVQEMKSIARLVVAETQVALSRVGTLLGCVILLLVAALMTWALVIALIYQCILNLDFTPISALLILVCAHVALCVALMIAVLRLGNKFTFPLSRQALSPSSP